MKRRILYLIAGVTILGMTMVTGGVAYAWGWALADANACGGATDTAVASTAGTEAQSAEADTYNLSGLTNHAHSPQSLPSSPNIIGWATATSDSLSQAHSWAKAEVTSNMPNSHASALATSFAISGGYADAMADTDSYGSNAASFANARAIGGSAISSATADASSDITVTEFDCDFAGGAPGTYAMSVGYTNAEHDIAISISITEAEENNTATAETTADADGVDVSAEVSP